MRYKRLMSDRYIRSMAVCFIWLSAAAFAFAQEEFALRLRPSGGDLQLHWQVTLKTGETAPKFEVQASSDCVHWNSIATNLTSANGLLSVAVSRNSAYNFYRVRSDQKLSLTADGGDEIFGYNRALQQKLARMDWISADDFASAYPSGANYLSQIDFDVTAAAYWDSVDMDSSSFRSFHMNDLEKAVLQQNGFVASGRLGSSSCIQLYYDIFHRDLPVFVTTDSILQAWHRSYDAMLAELETTYLSVTLYGMLSGMAGQIQAINHAYGSGPLKQSILDADYYLTVGRSLINGTPVASSLNQETAVSATLSDIASLSIMPFDLFGRLQKDPGYLFDFSQFKVRGHYTESKFLSRYFQAMMWCGRVDLRVAGNAGYASPRELGAAMVLLRALQESGQMAQWNSVDQLLQVLVGPVDSMTFAQLDALLKASPIKSLSDVKSLDDLAAVQASIEAGSLGFQDITSDLYYSPMSSAQLKLPRSFTMLGQRFTQDSWAMGSVVFDKIIWSPNGENSKVERRIPSALDVAFSVFANDQTVPAIVARMKNNSGRAFRDRLPYQRNLAAVREVIDSQSLFAWTNNIYNGWLGALRQLSPPTTDPAYPQCMRTRPWAMKTLNTQLASWTELRHDTILYVKQTYTPNEGCSYPKGFIEPVPGFWHQMGQLATKARDLLQGIPMNGPASYEDRYGQGVIFSTDLGTVKTNQLTFLSRFADNMTTLETMSEKELRQEPYATNEILFLQDIVEKTKDYWGNDYYNGWYPKLYYRDSEGFDAASAQLAASLGLEFLPYDSTKWDAIVTDVHTDSADDQTGDPGMILHEGLGNVCCLITAIDSGPDRCIYLGPVLSHYEFEEPLGTRLSDEEWQAQLTSRQYPSQPDWTKSYYLP